MAFSYGPLTRTSLARMRASCPCSAREASTSQLHVDRRAVLAAVAIAPLLAQNFQGAQAGATPAVGTYLPKAGVDDFVLFKPSSSKTPAIRAGTVDPSNPYTFALPPGFSERPVANIKSGNYCQPRCGEPWTEVIFADDKEGSASVIAAPLVKLTNKKNARIEDVGDPQGFLNAIGPFITGTYLDDDDVISMDAKTQDDGLTYYFYEVNASYGTTGPHTLTACTVKGDLALLFCIAATDKQWAVAEKKLRKMVTTFRA